MKGLLVLAVGIGFLLSSFVWAAIRTKAVSSAADKRWLSLTYTALVGASLALSGLLCLLWGFLPRRDGHQLSAASGLSTRMVTRCSIAPRRSVIAGFSMCGMREWK